MPEMTPERIASLAQSAMERDPNPTPLDAAAPRNLYGASVCWLIADSSPVHQMDTLTEVEDYEVSHDGLLTVRCVGETVEYAPGRWTRLRIYREKSTEDAR